MHGQVDLRMELDTVDAALFVVDSRNDFVRRLGGNRETGAQYVNAVAVRQQNSLERCESSVEALDLNSVLVF